MVTMVTAPNWELADLRRKADERDEVWQRLLHYGYYDVPSEAQAEALCECFEGVRWTVVKGTRVYMGVRDWRYRVFRLGFPFWEEAPR